MTVLPASEVKAEEGSQKGDKATYKSFKYVLTFNRAFNAINLFSVHIDGKALLLILAVTSPGAWAKN